MSFRPIHRKKAALPSVEKLEGTRRRILETALQLFATRGFAGSSVRDITKALELQPSALYAHFTSKEELLGELSTLGHEAQETAIVSAFRAASSEPVDQLRAMVRTNALLHATYPHLVVVVNEELHALPQTLAAPSFASRARLTALLMDVLGRGVRAKQFSAENLTVTAAAIAAISARIPYWYSAQPELEPEALAELQADLALRMVGYAETRKTGRSKGRVP